MPLERVDIQDLRDEYVICRTLGHSWDDHPEPEFSPEMWRLSLGALALRCTRCHAERYDYIGPGMDIQYRRYVYPLAYHSIVGEGKRPNLRGEMVRRKLLVHIPSKRRNGK